jgi:hypothetical protein
MVFFPNQVEAKFQTISNQSGFQGVCFFCVTFFLNFNNSFDIRVDITGKPSGMVAQGLVSIDSFAFSEAWYGFRQDEKYNNDL